MANKNGQSNLDTLATSGIQDTEDDQQQKTQAQKTRKKRERRPQPPPLQQKKHKLEVELATGRQVLLSCKIYTKCLSQLRNVVHYYNYNKCS